VGFRAGRQDGFHVSRAVKNDDEIGSAFLNDDVARLVLRRFLDDVVSEEVFRSGRSRSRLHNLFRPFDLSADNVRLYTLAPGNVGLRYAVKEV
jgi:hypothetical protein